MTNQPAPSDTPLSGEWKFNNGVLCCGTLRIARPDFDTNPSDEFKAELFRWLTETLNNAARLSAEREKERGELHLEIERLETRIEALDKEAGEIEDKRIDGAVTISGLKDTIGSLTATLAERDRQLAEAKQLATNWEDSAKYFNNGLEFYRGLIHRIGEGFGDKAKTSDDGSVQEDVLALKVPELVEDLQAQLAASERQRKEMEGKVALVARALELALIPLAVFKITEADQPYTEHSPSLKKMLSEAHDAVCEALQSLHSTPETTP